MLGKKTAAQSLLRVQLILYYYVVYASDIPLNRLSHNPFAAEKYFISLVPLAAALAKKELNIIDTKVHIYLFSVCRCTTTTLPRICSQLHPLFWTSAGCHIWVFNTHVIFSIAMLVSLQFVYVCCSAYIMKYMGIFFIDINCVLPAHTQQTPSCR